MPASLTPRPKPTREGYGLTPGENAAALLAGILLVILIPSILTLRTVDDGVTHVHSANPTPHGYTVSLLLYLVPIGALATWFLRKHPPGVFRRRAFFLTIGLLAPIGFGLDFVFGNLFFDFPNHQATLGLMLPGFSFATRGIVWDLPIEEFVFYLSGFVAILLVYIWCDEVWVPAYGVDDYGDPQQHPPYIIRVHLKSLAYAVIAILLAIAYKKLAAPIEADRDYREGFPLYFVFLVGAALLPSLLFFRTAQPFMNWRAFSVTLLWVLLTSLLWEATLASPFGWWHYRYEWMMGLHVKAWASLPVEAAFLWVAVTFTTTIVYETIKIGMHMHAPLRERLVGPPAGPQVAHPQPSPPPSRGR